MRCCFYDVLDHASSEPAVAPIIMDTQIKYYSNKSDVYIKSGTAKIQTKKENS